MKKYLKVFAVFAVLLSIVGCSCTNPEDTTSTTTHTTTSTTTSTTTDTTTTNPTTDAK